MIRIYRVEQYHEAMSLGQALELLAEDPDRQVIAGGTDLLIKMRDGILKSASLVSIRNIKTLQEIRMLEDKSISIGPLVTFQRLLSDHLVSTNLPILAEAAMTVGGPQVREMATVGGNICNGVPSADSAPPLLVLDAVLKLQSRDGERVVPVEQFFLGPGRVDLQPGEMLTAILIGEEGYRSCGGSYIKFSPRRAMDLAIIGVAAACRLSAGSAFEQVRIALGVAGPTPLRCSAAEKYVQGKEITAGVLAEAGRLALEAASPRSSLRASKEYRAHLITELTGRALAAAAARAGGLKNE